MTSATTPLIDRLGRRLEYTQARQNLQRDLERLMSSAAPAAPPVGPVIGIASLDSGPWHLVLEVLLGHALRVRGARPELLICDLPDLPACDERTIASHSRDRCDGCLGDKRALLDACGLPWRPVSSLLTSGALERARATVAALDDDALVAHRERGWPIGEWLHVSSCHYLRRDAGGNDPEQIDARRRTLTLAIVMAEVVERWLDLSAPDRVIVESGAHITWRIVRELARAREIPVTCREMGKGGWDRHIYALNADCMTPDLQSEWEAVRTVPLTPHQEQHVASLLDELPSRTFLPPIYARSAPLPRHARTITVFTNVSWDLATAGRNRAFASDRDWLAETVRAVENRPGAHLIVRAHPAESTQLTRDSVVDQLRADFPVLPDNVTLIAPNESITAADLCEHADVIAVYNSTAGLEAAARGKAVLVCGTPHFGDRGFTIDVRSREDYLAMLGEWLNGVSIDPPPSARLLARRYAHLFFHRYHVTMGWTTSPIEPPFSLTVQSMRELLPGANPAVDAVCDGILNSRQILFPRAEDLRS